METPNSEGKRPKPQGWRSTKHKDGDPPNPKDRDPPTSMDRNPPTSRTGIPHPQRWRSPKHEDGDPRDLEDGDHSSSRNRDSPCPEDVHHPNSKTITTLRAPNSKDGDPPPLEWTTSKAMKMKIPPKPKDEDPHTQPFPNSKDDHHPLGPHWSHPSSHISLGKTRRGGITPK